MKRKGGFESQFVDAMKIYNAAKKDSSQQHQTTSNDHKPPQTLSNSQTTSNNIKKHKLLSQLTSNSHAFFGKQHKTLQCMYGASASPSSVSRAVGIGSSATLEQLPGKTLGCLNSILTSQPQHRDAVPHPAPCGCESGIPKPVPPVTPMSVFFDPTPSLVRMPHEAQLCLSCRTRIYGVMSLPREPP